MFFFHFTFSKKATFYLISDILSTQGHCRKYSNFYRDILASINHHVSVQTIKIVAHLFCLVFLNSSVLFVVFLNPAGSHLHHMFTDRYEATLHHEAAHLHPTKTTWKHFS